MKVSVDGCIRRAVHAAFAAGIVGTAAPAALAQDVAPTEPASSEAAAPQAADTVKLKSVVVTGSAIRRIQAEGALPVQVISEAEIKRTGASSVVDLLQRLPVVQGSTAEAAAVGGSTFGFAGISLHNIGETRTLVLLNGRRMAQFGGQTLTGFAASIDLNSIPISAIERVEILTDGASAVYGSDAVAGVVNFITKKKTTEGDITASFYAPADGAREKGVSLSKGFGDYERSGWNMFLALSADKRDVLKSTDRKFAESGIVNFAHQGQNYQFFNGSASPIPATIQGTTPGSVLEDTLVTIPHLQTGVCPAGTALFPLAGPNACYYDYVRTLEIYPIRDRKTAMASFNYKIGESQNFFADIMYAKSEQESAIAPVPGSFRINEGDPLWDQYIAGLTGPDGLPVATGTTIARYRVFDMGNRRTYDTSKFYQAVAGLEGEVSGWDYNFAITQSESKVSGDISGYPGTNAFLGTLAAGLIDPFVGPGQQTQAGLDALGAINYQGYWDGGVSRLQTATLQGSHTLDNAWFGNPLQVALGASVQREKFQSKPSEFAQANLDDPVAGTPAAGGPGTGDQRFGDAAAAIPYGADRQVVGLFGEAAAKVSKNVELTTAVRWDSYDDVGETINGKVGFRATPTPGFLVRGSVGTGFKAPTVPQLKASLQSYGVTSSTYDCTPELEEVATSLGANCRPNGQQYDQFAGGNPSLKPETSTQATLGFVLEPSSRYSFGADYWWVRIKDTFGQISEGEAFANPLAYFPGSWSTATDPGTGETYVAFNAGNLNLGEQVTSGIDLDGKLRFKTPIGRLTSQVIATYMLTDKTQISQGGEFFESIGDYSEQLGAVTFRWQGRWINALDTGKFGAHSLTLNFKSGYKDAETEVFNLDASGDLTGDTSMVALDVDPYYTLDWQSNFNVIEPLTVSVGVLNLFDKDPPLTLATDGGHPIGYDLRYYDPRGRSLYAKVSYSF